MSTNFDFLTAAPAFSSFSTQAIEAEKSLVISPATSAILSRRALELAVRWVYVSDDGLKLPYRDNLSALIHEETFRDILEPRLFPMLKYTVRLGNTAVHTNQKIKRDDAILSLRNLFEFCKWIEYCYSTQYQDYEDAVYDEALLESADSAEIRRETQPRPEELQELYAKLGSRDKKLEEISHILDENISTVKSRLYRAMKKLRKVLDDRPAHGNDDQYTKKAGGIK